MIIKHHQTVLWDTIQGKWLVIFKVAKETIVFWLCAITTGSQTRKRHWGHQWCNLKELLQLSQKSYTNCSFLMPGSSNFISHIGGAGSCLESILNSSFLQMLTSCKCSKHQVTGSQPPLWKTWLESLLAF